LRQVLDQSQLHAAVSNVMAQFAAGIDSCDWALYRSVFADEIELDYSSWRSGSLGRWKADDWVDRAARLFPGLSATRHSITNVWVTPVADEAGTESVLVRANVCADHVIVAGGRTEVFTLNGVYHDRLTRSDDRWLIDHKRLVVEWCSGDRSLLERAAADVADGRPRR
jgi:3-phenylpropionate/cinnamic acid dioxygenase small subunit